MVKILKNNINILKYLHKVDKEYIYMNFFMSLIYAISPIISNLLIKLALESVTITGKVLFFRMIKFYVVYSLLTGGINLYYTIFFQPKHIEYIEKIIRQDALIKSKNMSMEKISSPKFYDEYAFIVNNLESRFLDSFNTIIELFRSFLSIVFLFIFLVTIDYRIIIVVLLFSLFNFVVNFGLSKMRYKKNKVMVRPEREINYLFRVFLLFDYAKELRVTNVYKPLMDMYEKSYEKILKIIKSYGNKEFRILMIMQVTQVLYISGIILYLVKLLIKKQISAGDFAAGFNSITQLSGAINNFLSSFTNLSQNSLFYKDFKKFYEDNSEACEINKIKIKEISSISFENVYFKYPNNENYILKNVSFTINKGERVAFMGMNGSGKSTVIYLMLKLYEPTYGTIFINGINLNHIDTDSYYPLISVLFQDSNIYAMSLLENILLDKPVTCNSEKLQNILQCFKDLGFPYKESELKKQLTNEFVDDGMVLSMGQNQKIMITRALFDYKDFVILDEPTNYLDELSKLNFYDRLFKIERNKTIVLISHDMEIVNYVEKIFVLENGEILIK